MLAYCQPCSAFKPQAQPVVETSAWGPPLGTWYLWRQLLLRQGPHALVVLGPHPKGGSHSGGVGPAGASHSCQASKLHRTCQPTQSTTDRRSHSSPEVAMYQAWGFQAPVQPKVETSEWGPPLEELLLETAAAGSDSLELLSATRRPMLKTRPPLCKTLF